MTKKLTLLLVVMMLAITSSAQIQRTILGCTLGVSTEAQVKKAMKAKGVSLKRVDDGLMGHNVTFAGVKFDAAEFCFKKHKLEIVIFMCYNSAKFDNFSTALKNKYGSYERDDSEENILIFDDGETYISLSNDDLASGCFTLIYFDNKLNQASRVDISVF